MVFNLKEDKLRGRPGYEHLNDPLHILIEADLPANIVDMRLRQAQEIIEELLKPVVFTSCPILLLVFHLKILYNHLIFDCVFTCFYCYHDTIFFKKENW